MITSFFKPKRSPNDDDAPSNADENNNENNKQKLHTGNNTGGDNNNKHELSTTTTNNTKRHKTSNRTLSSETMQLISYLNKVEEKVDEKDRRDDTVEFVCWSNALERHFSTPSFARLASFVESQRRDTKSTIFPPVQDTFTALNWTPLDKVKVVIVGQDPYHGPHQAHGLCFSVHKGVRVPPSLRNIYKELMEDTDIPNFTRMPTHGYLERWAKQGVLMINTVLTVRQGEANSHKNKGWEEVTDEIIRAVDRRSREKEGGLGVVFLLWGSPATKKAQIALGTDSTSSRHTIIATSHPSPLGATKTDSPFLGSKCFSRANQALKEMGCSEIDWRVDGAL